MITTFRAFATGVRELKKGDKNLEIIFFFGGGGGDLKFCLGIFVIIIFFRWK